MQIKFTLEKIYYLAGWRFFDAWWMFIFELPTTNYKLKQNP